MQFGKKLSLSLITILLLSLHATTLAARNLYDIAEETFTRLNTDQQLESNYVRAVTQDKYGFIWIGTENGLYRYDGYHFKHFKHDPEDPASIGGNFIYATYAHSNGELWISTTSSISIFNPETNSFRHIAHDPGDANSLVNNEVNHIYGSRDGRIWIATYSGLDVKLPGQPGFKHYRHDPKQPESLSDNLVFRVTEAESGEILVGTNKGLDKLNPDDETFSHIQNISGTLPSLKNQRIRSIFEDATGKVWLGTYENGLYWLDGDQLKREHPSFKAFPQLHQGQIRQINEINIGHIWVPTYAQGIGVIARDTGEFLRVLTHNPAIPSTINSPYIQALVKDKSGLTWLGHREGNGGINLYNAKNKTGRMIYYKPESSEGMDIKRINTILETQTQSDHRKTIWLAGVGINRLDANTGHKIELPEGLKAYDKLSRAGIEIIQLLETADHKLWFLFYDQGLITYDPVTQSVTRLSESQIGCELTARMAYDGDANIWVACNENPSLTRIDIDSLATDVFALDPSGEIKFSKINTLLFDQKKTLWIGSEHGLFYRHDDVSTSTSSKIDGQPETGNLISQSQLGFVYANNLISDNNNRIWLDTQQGLYLKQDLDLNTPFLAATKVKDSPQGEAFGGNMVLDDRGWIWGDKGVLDTENNQFYPLQVADGFDLSKNWPHANTSTKNGNLLFGNSYGLLVIKPDEFKPWNFSPKLVVTDLKIDGQAKHYFSAAEQPPPITIPSEARGFSLEFSALDFSDPTKNQYRYRLKGYDKIWIEADAEHRQISYSNLPPDNYLLEIKGTNRVGKWSPHQLAIEIRVLPAWYETFSAKTIAVLLFICLLYCIYFLRVKQLQIKGRQLSMLVKQRTEELNLRNHELETKTGELSQTLTELVSTQEQLVIQEKMTSLGELVSGIAHEVNTPIGIGVTAASHLQDRTEKLRSEFNKGSLSDTELKNYINHAYKTSDLLLKNLNRSAKLVQNFKGIAVAQSVAEHEELNLSNLLREIERIYYRQFLETRTKLDIKCDDSINIIAEPDTIIQIVDHLIANAILHGYTEGAAADLKITATKFDPNNCLFNFSDKGMGIDESVVQRVFDPFFTTKRAQGGMGLGLSIVFNLVTLQLKGTIVCKSKKTQGTEFNITMPCTYSTPEAPT